MSLSRRVFLAGGAVSALAQAARAQAPPFTRGLWHDSRGAFAVGLFPEFGDGPFAFDYGMLTAVRLVQKDGAWRLSTSLGGIDAGPVLVAWEDSRLRVGTRVLKPVQIRRTPIEARHSEVTLSGEWTRAGKRRPKGTIALLHGSGPAQKEALDLWAFWFLSEGFAVLTYDKRGCGRSSGDWRVAGLETLASDARAVISAARSAIPETRVQLLGWGISQGGWLLPQLAAAGTIDGSIVHAGAATTPGDQILAAVEAELRAYNFPEAEITKALAFYSLDTEVSRGHKPFKEVEALYGTAAAAGAEWLIAPLAAHDAPERTMIRLMAPFDPLPYWRQSDTPALVILGGKDHVVPAGRNRALFESLLGRRRGSRVVTLKDANHLMFAAKTGVRAEYPRLSRIDAGYFTAMRNWLRSRTFLAEEGTIR